MPLGIVTDNDFDSELSHLGIVIPEITPDPVTEPSLSDMMPAPEPDEEVIIGEVIPITRGRGNVTEVPQVIRQIIAEKAIIEGGTAEIAKEFGVSKSSVDAYKHGATSTKSYSEPDKDLLKHNTEVKQIVSTTARQKLLDALNEITPDKIAGVKVRDIASIAKDLSSVVRDMDSAQQNGNNPGVRVMVYSPRLRDEDEFEVITVNE